MDKEGRIILEDRIILTWREMAILGWQGDKVFEHCRCENRKTANAALRKARKLLFKQGWTFPHANLTGVPSPPAQALVEQEQTRAREIAARQQRSNWLIRIPSNAK